MVVCLTMPIDLSVWILLVLTSNFSFDRIDGLQYDQIAYCVLSHDGN